jgi:hypothetical protein
MLLLSFLPWHLIKNPVDAKNYGSGDRRTHPKAPVLVVMTLIALQLAVSFLRIELSPLLSTYDMYATTYSSPAEYEQKAGPVYWIVGVDEDQPASFRIDDAPLLRPVARDSKRVTGIDTGAHRLGSMAADR